MQIAANTVVSIDYTLTNDVGEVLDSSKGAEPLAYIHGTGQIIPGLENALVGKQQGDAFKVRIEACDAYGDRDEYTDCDCNCNSDRFTYAVARDSIRL